MSDYDFSKAVYYHEGQFPPQELDYARLIGPLGQTALALGRFDALLSTLPNQDLLLAPLRRQEAVLSSRIEGTIATLEDIYDLEAMRDHGGKADVRNETREVRSYVRAMDFAEHRMRSELPLSGRLLRDTHRHLLLLSRGGMTPTGQFKTQQNYIADSGRKVIRFVPIEPAKLPEGMARLERFLHDPSIDPILRAAIAHGEFEALHPFADGNGRLGRMLVTLSLWEQDVISRPCFYVSSEIETRRDEYIQQLRDISATGSWSAWCLFFLDVLDKQALRNAAIAERMVRLYDTHKSIFPELLSSRWSIHLLDAVFSQPIFTNQSVARQTGIPKASVARFTKALADGNVIEVLSEGAGRRSTRFIFRALFDAVRG